MSRSIRSLVPIFLCAAAACGEVTSTPIDAAIDTADIDTPSIDAATDAPVDAPIDAVPTFVVTVTPSGGGAGTVTSSPAGINCGSDCTEAYAENTGVTLTAAAAPGSTFVGWSGGGCTGTGACVIAVTADVTITPMFALNNSLVVTTTGTGTGGVTSSPAGINCGADCSESFPPATVVTLTAVASANSTFTGWSGGGCSGTGTCVVTTNMAVGIVATFTLQQFTLTVTRAGTGTGGVTSSPAGINCGADCSEVYTTGTVVTLAAAPASGSTFTGWSGGGCSGTGACVVTLTAATNVTATFTLQQFTLTVTRAGTGAGTVTSAPAGINCGTDCTEAYGFGTLVGLTATPAAGSTFAGWSGACTGTGACSVPMTAAQSVTATFTLQQLTLTVTRSGTGTGTVTSSPAGINCGVDCTESYSFGTVVVLTATAGAGSTFVGWSGAGCSGTGTCTVTMSAAQAVNAQFTAAPTNCDNFNTYPDGTTVPNWTENAGDWFIQGGRLRNAIPNGVYGHNITMNGSSQLNGCGRLTAIHTGSPSIQVVGVVLRWQLPANFIIALVQDNSNTGNFNSAWIYQNPGTMSIGGNLTNQNFGVTPNVEACVSGTAVTLRIDAAQDGIYETTLTGTTTITTAGLTGVMAASQTTDVNSMPRIDNFCWGP